MKTSREFKRFVSLVERVGGTVGVNDLDGHEFIDVDAMFVGEFNDEHLRAMSELKEAGSIEVLRLVETGITDVGCGYISKCTGLEFVNIGHTQVSDEGVMKLGNLRRLVSLAVGSCDVTDRSIQAISGSLRLKSIELAGTRVTNKSIELLLPMGTLEGLMLQSCEGITDRCLHLIEKAECVEIINVAGTACSQGGVERLRTRRKDLQVLFEEDAC